MAKEVITNAKVVIDSYDFANNALDATINLGPDIIDVTGFSASAWREFLAGLLSWSVTLGFHHDFADNAVNEKLFDWVVARTAVTIEVTKADTTVAPTNPKWSGSVLFGSGVPVFGGSIGAVSGGSITLQGTGTLTRAVS